MYRFDNSFKIPNPFNVQYTNSREKIIILKIHLLLDIANFEIDRLLISEYPCFEIFYQLIILFNNNKL
jgi:hypothetical protein